MSIYLTSKPRYEILDGLRGVAALIVVAYHLCETCFGLTPAHPINHGHLAVDFFFALSGFVIGYAYDDRWNRMSTWDFFKRRLIRLHPLVIFGTLFGMCMFYLTDCETFPNIMQTPWYVVVGVVLICFTMIPLPPSLDIRGWGETNPFTNPVWSLQFEYVANILYALIFRHLPKLLLAICVVFFALMTLSLCLNIDVTGLLAGRSFAYTVVGGWNITPPELLVGFTRLLYPFFAGLLLSRLGWLIRVRAGFWWCSLLIVVVLFMPWIGSATTGESRLWNGVYEAAVILFVFPLIVSMGAGSSVTDAKSSAVNKFLGDISYPLYITHYPFVSLQTAWVSHHPDASASTHLFVGICLYLMAIGVAYASFRLYDVPVREWLKRKLFR